MVFDFCYLEKKPQRQKFEIMLTSRIRFSSSIAEKGPLAEYQRRLRLGILKPDQDQFRTAVALQTLADKLEQYEPEPHRPLFRLPRLLKNERKIENVVSSQNSLVSMPLNQVKYGPKGLWLHGGVGTGKTMLMDIFYDTVAVRSKTRTHFHTFMLQNYRRIHEHLKTNSDKHVMSVLAAEILSNSWLICLDEFQNPDIASAAIMKALFSKLFAMGAVLVTSSNRLPKDLYTRGFHRADNQEFIKLLGERNTVLKFTSKNDYRLTGEIATHQSYFLCNTPESKDAFLKRVFALFNGKSLKSRFIGANGHVVRHYTQDGVAIFTFEELCGSNIPPWGPTEYFRICETFQTIVVQSVPQMGLLEVNEAKRFITFIDAAYENKTKLIISADAEPEDLFIVSDQQISNASTDDLLDRDEDWNKVGGGDKLLNLAIFAAEEEKFAFKRAVSRIREMLSEAYLKCPHSPQPLKLNIVSPQPESRVNVYTDQEQHHKHRRRHEAKPLFSKKHFWSLGNWGIRAGRWGKGIDVFPKPRK